MSLVSPHIINATRVAASIGLCIEVVDVHPITKEARDGFRVYNASGLQGWVMVPKVRGLTLVTGLIQRPGGVSAVYQVKGGLPTRVLDAMMSIVNAAMMDAWHS